MVSPAGRVYDAVHPRTAHGACSKGQEAIYSYLSSYTKLPGTVGRGTSGYSNRGKRVLELGRLGEGRDSRRVVCLVEGRPKGTPKSNGERLQKQGRGTNSCNN